MLRATDDWLRKAKSAEKIITIMSIKLYITGGTIDKEYSPINGELVFIKTHLLEMLEQAKNKVDIEPEVLMLKDSLDMSDNDRAIILKKCETAKEEKNLNNARNRYNCRNRASFGQKYFK